MNCRNITVRNLTIEEDAYGICFFNTSNSIMDHNLLRKNNVGIGLIDSDNNILYEKSLTITLVDLSSKLGSDCT